MSVLSATAQKQVEDVLVRDGLLTAQKLEELKEKAKKDNMPLLSVAVGSGGVSNEALTKAIAQVTKVPYVNLSKAQIDTKTLSLLSQDIAERYMAVPLGEMQHRLVVAMLDADNVQAVDFLANKIGRPLKVYAASEVGIKHVLKQYQGSLSQDVVGVLKKAGEAVEAGDESSKALIGGDTNIKTIVQDSPISKALSTILEFAARN